MKNLNSGMDLIPNQATSFQIRLQRLKQKVSTKNQQKLTTQLSQPASAP